MTSKADVIVQIDLLQAKIDTLKTEKSVALTTLASSEAAHQADLEAIATAIAAIAVE